MGLYGLPCAAALFDAKLLGMLKKEGFERVEMGFAVKQDKQGNTQTVVTSWIDDLLTGLDKKTLDPLMTRLYAELNFGSRVSIVPSSTRKFSGIDIEREHGGDIVLSQETYLQQCNTVQYGHAVVSPWRETILPHACAYPEGH
uniref:Reverse transcriptase Ty1/copia-type domain-containing protein n=1 Tax=Chromera velia CCMP2878 TaxID=1169474 RepID=A0A0G4FAT7_9ALVE|eukprot:Cvel_15961.t1-p1 / transcript=Cvel_15961.t1 / gene=Cvel_15961 / organism=Chromera_velia_CCMP2878 / gene_product=hypothetical protein / transcript_product=hypothetical protein / location=Cvel_scaffold1207:28109-28534(+) / protein_length=142 / sequence_SO=supercontig / SO=protein_coding / is_pseudo=false